MTKTQFLFVGLGNPGDKYLLNRHNIGFLVLDAMCKFHSIPRYTSKYQGEFSSFKIGDDEIFLLKPQTFMNLSGKSVGELVRFYKIPLSHVFVVHDDLDLEPGKVKIKIGGGNGGHNGLTSLDQHIGKDYVRVRVGIGHPGHKDLVTPYVLGNFSKNDKNWLEPVLWNLGLMLPELTSKTVPVWLNDFALKMKNS